MSKGNMLLGHARGKVGDLVFSRVNGQQVTRARAAIVKNPQTEAQMIQRILLNTVIQAYSRMSEICDHSFEGVPVGQQSMSVFMKRNLALLRQHISDEVNIEGHTFDDIYSFSPIGSNEFTVNPFVLSSGSLPIVNLTNVNVFDGASFAITAAGATLTYNDVITSLGLNRGDQLTFISQQAWTDRRAAFNYARVILDPRDSDGNTLPLDTAFLDGTNINMPNPRNEGVQLQYSYADGSFTFQMSDRSQWGAAVIVSRQKTDGSWLRSNASLVLDSAFQLVVNARSLQECLDLFAAGSIDVENPMYLNNARRVTGASAARQLGFEFNTTIVQPNGTIPTNPAMDTPLVLVSVSETEMNDGSVVVVTDIDGNNYTLFNNNTYASIYSDLYADMQGIAATTESGTWRATPKTRVDDTDTYTGTIPMIHMYAPGDDNYINNFVEWLISKGCDVRGFINVRP